jgi:hypothetical protein
MVNSWLQVSQSVNSLFQLSSFYPHFPHLIKVFSVLKMEMAVDIITLDNFESKMPKWEPGSESHLYALVDMGR